MKNKTVRLEIDAGFYPASGDEPAYYLGGVWATDGRIAWGSEPESYSTRDEALNAAREAKRDLLAGEIIPATISLRSERMVGP